MLTTFLAVPIRLPVTVIQQVPQFEREIGNIGLQVNLQQGKLGVLSFTLLVVVFIQLEKCIWELANSHPF